MSEFFTESKNVHVSQISKSGWWLGNVTEHVAAGTALGDEFTINIYEPTKEGLIARYDRETDTWSDEIEDMSHKKFYSTYGQPFVIGVPDGDFPEGAIKEEPPEYNPEKQTVLYKEGEGWTVFDIKIGEAYYNEFGEESIVTDFNFELPNNCSWVAPPVASEGFAVRLVGGVWTQVSDNRGQLSYSIETKEPVIVDYLGDVKEGYTLTAPTAMYEEWDSESGAWVADEAKKLEAEKAVLRNQAIQTRTNAVYADIIYNGNAYQTGEGKDGIRGIENIQEAYTLLAAGLVKAEDTRSWITSDNQSVVITYADIHEIYLSYGLRKADVYEQYQAWIASDVLTPFEYVKPE